MANALGVNQNLFSGSPTALQIARGDPGLTPGYIATSARLRQGAQQANMFPSEGQETMWSLAMPLMEGQTSMGLRAREILDKGLLTPEFINGSRQMFSCLCQSKETLIHWQEDLKTSKGLDKWSLAEKYLVCQKHQAI